MTRQARRILGEDRARAQARAVGREVRVQRAALAMSQRQLAGRAGVATSTVVRIEEGDQGVQLNTLVCVAAAVGIDIVVRAFPAGTPRLRDSGQMTVAQELVRLASGVWQPRLEVPAGDHGRAADLLLFGPEEILHVEIERTIVDFQAQYRAITLKRQALAAMHARPVRLVLAVSATARNRSALQPFRSLLESELPAGSRRILSSLRTGRPLGTDGLLWLRPAPSPGP